MGLATSMQVAATAQVGDVSLNFARLNIHDIAELTASIKTSRKKAAKEAGKELNLTTHELYNVLTQIDMADPTVGDVLDYAMTPAGAADICTRSLKKAGQAFDVADLDAPLLVQAAQQVVVFRPGNQPKNLSAGTLPAPSTSTPSPSPEPASSSLPPQPQTPQATVELSSAGTPLPAKAQQTYPSGG